MDFNAKKSRAQKIKKDKYQDRSHKAKHKKTQEISKSNAKIPDANPELSNSSSSDNEESETQNYSRRKIRTNEFRYDEPLPEDDSEKPLAGLEELASLDEIKGGIFHFKDEAAWESCSENIDNKHFHLDLEQLAMSLAAVPFYRRIELSDNLFSFEEKEKMDRDAKICHENHIKKLNCSVDKIVDLDKLVVKIKKKQKREVKPITSHLDDNDCNVGLLTEKFKNVQSLTDLLASTSLETTSKQIPAKEESTDSEGRSKETKLETTEDLSEWLDSILDD